MTAAEEKERISFRKLVYEALPELWSFQFWIKCVIGLMVFVISRLMNLLISTRADALTTANLKSVLLSPQGISKIIAHRAGGSWPAKIHWTGSSLPPSMAVTDQRQIFKGHPPGRGNQTEDRGPQ